MHFSKMTDSDIESIERSYLIGNDFDSLSEKYNFEFTKTSFLRHVYSRFLTDKSVLSEVWKKVKNNKLSKNTKILKLDLITNLRCKSSLRIISEVSKSSKVSLTSSSSASVLGTVQYSSKSIERIMRKELRDGSTFVDIGGLLGIDRRQVSNFAYSNNLRKPSTWGGYRQGSGVGKKSKYKFKSGRVVNCDSSYEFRFCKLLESENCTFEKVNYYFSNTIDHSVTYLDPEGVERRYYPDFYLPFLDIYVEIKGYLTEVDKCKLHHARLKGMKVAVLYDSDLYSLESSSITINELVSKNWRGGRA